MMRRARSPAPAERRWIPAESAGRGGRALESHETACLLNAGETDAHVAITVFFADREPAGRTA
jgi:hypothetical protein